MDKLYKYSKHTYKYNIKSKYGSKGVKKIWQKDAVQYNKVTYYPRVLDHQDPPIKPSKLLMIEKVKPYKGQPYWDKRILDDLKFGQFYNEKIAIMKNTPDTCQLLMKIKHLIKVTPIELPEKLPNDLLTNKETYLHENGKLLIFPRMDQNRLDAFDNFKTNVKRFDLKTMKKYLRLKWLNPIEAHGSVYNNNSDN